MASRVKGLDRLLGQIRRLPKAQLAAARKALQQGADELSESVRRAAPKRTGALAASVGWSWGSKGPPGSIGGGAERQALRDREGLTVTVHAGGKQAYYAAFVEFGTKAAPKGRAQDGKGKTRDNKRGHPATPAQPFFWPTVRAQKRRMKSRVTRESNKAVKAVAKS